jgi:hypothetical protein
VDVGPLLPAAIPAEDAAELLQQCTAVQHALSGKTSGKSSGGGSSSKFSAVVAGTCVASGQLVGQLAEKVWGEARSAAEQQLKLQQQQRKAAGPAPQPQGKHPSKLRQVTCKGSACIAGSNSR